MWTPTGTPTIARLIEKIDRSSDLEMKVVLTVKSQNPTWEPRDDEALRIDGLNSEFIVLKGIGALPSWFRKAREKLSDLRQLIRIYFIMKTYNPDLIYCDRVNILPAAVLSRITNIPVVWRIMGILEEMKFPKGRNFVRNFLNHCLWKSPFSLVICTQDGSGGEQWMQTKLNKRTRKLFFLNGFDYSLKPKKPSVQIPDAGIKILFAGRLEKIKGVYEFVSACAPLLIRNKNFYIVFAGSGSEENSLRQLVQKLNISTQTIFMGSLIPSEMRFVRQKCDINVSLNKMGNLSNVNLEALADGLAVIVPKSKVEKLIDTDTDKLIPENVFYRFGDVGDDTALMTAVEKFSKHRVRQSFSKTARAFGKEFIKDWNSRIDEEIVALKNVVSSRGN